jgi:opacity protein-like surface antigen
VTKKMLIFAGCMLVSFAIRDAGAFWIGGHGARTSGGDVTEDATGFGMQAGGRIDDNFSIEISGTKYKDATTSMKMDIVSLGVTGLAGVDVVENVRLFAGVGLDYNMFNAHIDVLELEASSKGMTVDEYVAASGLTVPALRTFMQEAGISADLRLRDTVGYHVCAGAAINVNEAFQVFTQYRYTWGRMKGDITVDLLGTTGSEKNAISGDYKFGLLMFGFNIIM